MPKKSYSYEMNTQIKMLKTEINELVKSKLPNDEFEFIKEYDSIVASLLVNEL